MPLATLVPRVVGCFMSKQMVGMDIKAVSLKPVVVIHPLTVAAKLGHEDLVSQALRGNDLGVGSGKGHLVAR